MSDLQARFETAAQEALELPKRPDNQSLLRLYALYKQATVGDAPAERPASLDFVGRVKHDAWVKLQGTAKEEAMQAYVDLVESLK